MQIDLLTTAAVCGGIGLACWIMAARNKRPDAPRDRKVPLGKSYLRSDLFTTWGNVWRWGYLVFNTLAVLIFIAMIVLSLQ